MDRCIAVRTTVRGLRIGLPCMVRLSTGTLAVMAAMSAHATAPVLYSQPALQSPTDGAPDDLLLIPGIGFSKDDVVVYEVVGGSERKSRPLAQPRTSDANGGVVPVASYENVPDSLTIVLPAALAPNRTYSLWVVTKHDEWSNRILINDARPLWFSPTQVTEDDDTSPLSRELKVVGRNLRDQPGAPSYVRLTGPESVTRRAKADPHASDILNESVVTVELPAHLKPGAYMVQISRDGAHWLTMHSQQFTVTPSAHLPHFSIAAASFGNCRPNDGRDDTPCLLAAIRAAENAGGGTVDLPPGVWDFENGDAKGTTTGDGIVVPRRVDLRGSDPASTTFKRSAKWNSGSTNALLTLQGMNRITGIKFSDQRRYVPSDPPSPFIQLGKVYYRHETIDPRSIDDVSIVGNIFDRPRIAISDGGLPVHRLVVAHNEFGAFQVAIALGGDRTNVAMPFELEDSVIAFNLFKPGSYFDLASEQGAIASFIGASTRLDFSHNVADGAAVDYLYDPADARGWRAGFFWHMNNNHEMMLVAQNLATCTGDKVGDGEAIAFDNNANTFAFDRAREAIASSRDAVAVAGPLEAKQNGQAVDPAAYYVGHWIQVVAGPGVGQARKIASYRADPTTKEIIFKVAPDWDVPPQAKMSRLVVGREFWQVYTLDNVVDQRRPLCQKSNRSRRAGGKITLWAQSSDSLIGGNRQYDTDGISFQQTYIGDAAHCLKCSPASFLQSFLVIRDNFIDGEYDWESDCSQSGIMGSLSASDTPDAPPPVVSYGITIAHNTIRHADAFNGGAISLPLTWFRGPWPHRWPVVNNTLIHHNAISDISGQPAKRSCEGESHRRLGLNIGNSGLVWRTVLYGNTCTHVRDPIFDGGVRTVRICGAPQPQSCECGGPTDR